MYEMNRDEKLLENVNICSSLTKDNFQINDIVCPQTQFLFLFLRTKPTSKTCAISTKITDSKRARFLDVDGCK